MQTLATEYVHASYAGLPPFERSREELLDRTHELESFRTLFLKHQLYDVVGISLLHKHFDIDADECLVETIFNDFSEIRRARVQAAARSRPYMWRHDVLSGRWMPVEFLTEQSCD